MFRFQIVFRADTEERGSWWKQQAGAAAARVVADVTRDQPVADGPADRPRAVVVRGSVAAGSAERATVRKGEDPAAVRTGVVSRDVVASSVARHRGVMTAPSSVSGTTVRPFPSTSPVGSWTAASLPS